MGKAKILVVEDDLHLLEGIRDILELDGYEVLIAENGLQALDIMREANPSPDLILSDIMMPRMDGIQFLKEMRKESRWLTIPFIFLTAKGEKADQHRGLRLGVDDYVVKPYDPADLLVKIESRLERHRKLNENHNTGMANLKRQILTMLNHEFRTPLTFVVAYSEMLNDAGIQKLSEEELMTYIKGIGIGADRLRNLIENFIMLVELETAEAEQTFKWRKTQITEIGLLFAEASKRVKEIDTGITALTTEIDGEIPIFEGDMDYLSLAISQLLHNAIKFSPPGAPIKLGARAESDHLVIWVQDEGRGIPPAEQANIWESFYQINRSLHEDQGAGAGLAIVQGVARLHGGAVSMESEEGVGSTFKILLPLAPVQEF